MRAALCAVLILASPAGAQVLGAAAEVRLTAPPVAVGAAPALAPASGLSAPALGSSVLSAPALALSAPAAAASPALAPAAAAPSADVAPAPAAASEAAPALVAAAPARDGADAAPRAASAFDGRRSLNVLMVGAEAVPFIKTGGLADVVDAVSRGLAARGHNVTLVLPKYGQLKFAENFVRTNKWVSVPIGPRQERARLWTQRIDGVNVVLLEHPDYYGSDGHPFDGNTAYGLDVNDERFAFYARAALEAARALNFKPDVAHAHDWHAALIPAYLKIAYAGDPFFAATRSIVTIHNLAFQGVYPTHSALKAGFHQEHLQPMGPFEYWGAVSYLKAGLVLADAVTTVSPTYAREIQSGPEFGMGLEGVLRARPDGVSGILNGVDQEMYDPREDSIAHARYGPENVAEGKALNKAFLQRRLGLAVEPETPLFAVASRLAHQKGVDLVIAAVDEMVARGAQVVIMGSGQYEKEVKAAVERHPGRVSRHPFDENFVRAVYAGADFLLMPSRFEPCGLSQLIAHRYGTLPIVTPTGGLADTVSDLRGDAERGDGVVMRSLSILGFVEAVEAAIAGYRTPGALAAARATAMSNDWSWGPALDAYVALYRRLVGAASANRAPSAAPASGDSASSTSSASDARRDGSTTR